MKRNASAVTTLNINHQIWSLAFEETFNDGPFYFQPFDQHLSILPCRSPRQLAINTALAVAAASKTGGRPTTVFDPSDVTLNVSGDVWRFLPRQGWLYFRGQPSSTILGLKDRTIKISDLTSNADLGGVVAEAINFSMRDAGVAVA